MSVFSPTKLNYELFKLGLQTTRLFASSSDVISKRSRLISKALQGDHSWADPEFTQMWQEKFIANNEAFLIWNKAFKNLTLHNSSLDKNAFTLVKTLNACTNSYLKEVKSNAKRLKSKTRK